MRKSAEGGSRVGRVLADAQEHKNALERILGVQDSLRRTPAEFAFNVKYYGSPITEETLVERVRSDLTRADSYSLYLHYPYCAYICRFCHYAVTRGPRGGDVTNDGVVDMLLTDLDLRLDLIPEAADRAVSSVYLGGGTPALLGNAGLGRLADGIRTRVNVAADAEWSVEATPDALLRLGLPSVVGCGFNRVSIGVETLDEALLQDLRRGHSADEAHKAVDACTAAGVAVNVDLMYGLPKQTPEHFLGDADAVAGWQPTSITTYRLRLGRPDERPAALLQEFMRTPDAFPNQVTTAIEAMAVRALLGAAGYVEAPLGWYSLPGSSARCYRDRWLDQRPLVGVGAGAYSYGSAWQAVNPRGVREWQDAVKARRMCGGSATGLTEEEACFRAAAFHLRHEGSTPSFGSEAVAEALDHVSRLGLGAMDLGVLRLNDYGYTLIDEIIDEALKRIPVR